jgi:Zn-finger nucleic acid-binding protein
MHCPVDNATLQMTSREGIEIDYCPECRGVWLDRGELDKLIERSSSPTAAAPQNYGDDDRERKHHDERRHDSHNDYDRDHHKKHKKESFLGDMFDF